jgi:hypothetical protein
LYSIKIDSKEAIRLLNNVVNYSQGFIEESKAKESYVASKLASTSITGFYQYLDVLARTNPGMLHHVYEWGQVGNPEARLVQLKKIIAGKKVEVASQFLTSTSIPENGSEPFWDKAEIMEEGIQVEINEVSAQALFFQIDGEEFFRTGPIVIQNPGGEQVRGSFVRAFEEFYNNYFDQVYLRSIRFYDHFNKSKEFESGFNSGVKSPNARSMGKKTALSWIINAPGEDYE